MEDDRAGAGGGGVFDVGAEIGVGGVAEEGGDFGHVDGGECVEVELYAVPYAGVAEAGAAVGVEALQGVGDEVEFHVDEADLVGGGPGHRVLGRHFAAEVDADAVPPGKSRNRRVHHPSPIFTAAMTAALGISTFPKVATFFFTPSCFSLTSFF